MVHASMVYTERAETVAVSRVTELQSKLYTIPMAIL